MSLLNPSKGWRSSSSRLLALYSSLFVAWSCILMGVLYYEVSGYLSDLSRHSLLQRQHLFQRFDGEELVEALTTSMTFDMKGVDAYGLFDEQFRPLNGPIRAIPSDLPWTARSTPWPIASIPTTRNCPRTAAMPWPPTPQTAACWCWCAPTVRCSA